jgi:endonuclease/exonuclease/phosphatase (EEP) superfamily protein YafD
VRPIGTSAEVGLDTLTDAVLAARRPITRRPPTRLRDAAVAATLCAATLPFTLARLAGGGTITPLPQLASLAPLGAVFALAAVCCAIAVRSVRIGIVAAVLLLVHLSWAAPGLVANRPAPLRGPTIEVRLLTLNTHLGEASAEAIVTQVRERDLDVLVLEELTPELVDRLQGAGLDRLLPNVHALPGEGAAGMGIYSRFAMRDHARAVVGSYFPMPQAYLALPGGRSLSITAVHPRSPRPGQVGTWESDLRVVAREARAVTGPQVVVGDFNASRDHAAFRTILSRGRLVDAADVLGAWPGLTWPTDVPGLAPFVRIDHVLVSPTSVTARQAATVAIPGTDHRGVAVDLAVAG